MCPGSRSMGWKVKMGAPVSWLCVQGTPPMQAAHARFSRTELPRVTHVQTIFSCSMTESPSWHVLGSKQSAPGTLETLSLGWGRGGAGVTGRQQGRATGAWILHQGKSNRCLPTLLPPKCPQAGHGAEGPGWRALAHWVLRY